MDKPDVDWDFIKKTVATGTEKKGNNRLVMGGSHVKNILRRQI
jgi:hypothetical protein